MYFSSIFRKVPLLDFFAKYFVKKYIFFSFFFSKIFLRKMITLQSIYTICSLSDIMVWVNNHIFFIIFFNF